MVPPAFTEVGQDVLHREFNPFVKNLPKVENIGVANDERSQEPIHTVHDIVMIEVIPNVGPLEFTIVIVGVHLLCDWFVQAGVKVAEKSSPLLSSQVKHEYEAAHISNRQSDYHSLQPLHRGTQPIFWIGLKI